MMITTLASLLMLLFKTYLPKGNWPLVITDIALLALSVWVIIISVQKFTNRKETAEIVRKITN
ncbi:hypothetical protein E4K67_11030 [Desulfosporosinus fructosivorans]|uniref:Uncharacterized protein n=2 Tax=Desulfosporosinus fructosivorans TaxID=2018669 RepID=A0A4Z0R7E5_9FIRM|nr:hypothetical protein E4K67_11030 [Desulfosporosinus fructosivorans]